MAKSKKKSAKGGKIPSGKKHSSDRRLFKKPVIGLNNYLKKNSKKSRSGKRQKPIFGLENYFRKNPSKRAKKRKITINIKKEFSSLFPSFRRYQKFLTATSIVVAAIGSLAYIYIFRGLPSPYELTKSKPPMTTIIRDRNGIVLYRVYREANRVELKFDEIPGYVKNSTIAIEDANFYNHHGIDLKAIVRAFLNNLKQEDIDYYQGASTLPQQLVKNRLLNSKKSYQRKIKEVILSVWTEAIYSKKDILTMYLNTVGYGGPAYGIEAASQMYFNKSARELSLAEAAFLAGLPAAPTTFSPYGTRPQLAYLRQQQVLERMLKLGMIDEKKYLAAINQKLTLAPQKINILAPHFVMYIKDEMVKRFGEKAVEEGGFDVTTTLDLNIQNKAQEIAARQVEEIKDRYRINNAAILVTNPEKAEILAMVGSVDYFDTANSGHYNATLALRQPGSSIKPVNYAYAFDNGYTPTSTVLDAPVVYRSPDSKEVYAPVNYDGKFHGTVTLRSALANSYNVPAVKILEKIGVDNMIKQGINMGIKSWHNLSQIGLSLTLGGAEVTMLDMARAYGTIRNLGIQKDLKPILSIKGVNSQNLTAEFYKDQDIALASEVKAEDKADSEGKKGNRVISPLSAWWLIDILSDSIARRPAFGLYAKLDVSGHKIAVKTGTSNNFRDNWTIGFTPDYLAAVWVGNNDGSFMNKNLVSGITGAAPIWNEVMSFLLKDAEAKEFPVPEGLIAVKVCAVNGLLTCPNCPQEKVEYFTADKVPTKQCYFRSKSDCETVKAQAEAEHKTDEEKKKLLSGCILSN